ncbi:MAG TPA: carboxypeptidase regulatory-like domain-containing protein [Tepidisphaeraceae bacterium]|nr:carboxypeptidase regulatory-like domain-containing protein [Tepidisphaeraceae bacterium]
MLLLCGCDSKQGNVAPPVPVIQGNGVVRGKVMFSGMPPVMHEIPSAACHDSSPAVAIMDETAVVGPAGGMKNVLVTIEGAGPGAPRDPSPILNQIHCTYVPHVIGVTVGQDLIVRSSDATMHNIHISGSAGDMMNFAMTQSGQEKHISFAKPEVLRAKCDVHPWMTAYIAVVENPLFAVTADDGTFEIKNVPAGSYKLIAWHEQYGRLEQPCVVSDDKPADVTLMYKAE